VKLCEIETPALLVNLDVMERNLRRAADYAAAHGLRLRPHTKTHKTPDLGRLQLSLGAAGLTVAKVGEAEVMVEAEPSDLLVAYPVIGTGKLQRLAEVARRGKVTVALDSLFAARQLSEAAVGGGVSFGVLAEVDVGLGRVGVTPACALPAGVEEGVKHLCGSLQVLGVDVARQPQAVQERIGYMPQRFGLYEDLTVQENLDLYADLHGVPAALRGPRYARLMQMTDLGPFTSRLAGKLSGGMKQKLGLACTLVRSPQLLLLDEPTVGVDPLSRRELWQIVEQLIQGEKIAALIATAYLDEAERCARVYLLREGRLLAGGELCAACRGVFVAVKPGHPAYHRW